MQPSAKTQAMITAVISFFTMLASYAIRYRLLRDFKRLVLWVAVYTRRYQRERH